MIDWTVKRIDSHIENRLYQSILSELIDHPATGSETTVIGVRSQFQIGKYRADFALWLDERGDRVAQLVVECDGKEYHTSDHDVRRDAVRDAELARMGWPTLRFTGSRIWRESGLCATEAIGKLSELARASDITRCSLNALPEWRAATPEQKLAALHAYFVAKGSAA